MAWWINKHKHLISNVFKFRVISLNAFWKFLMFGNAAWDFFGVNFWCRDFLGFCLKAYGYFGVLVFAPIRFSPSLEIQSTPPPLPPGLLSIPTCRSIIRLSVDLFNMASPKFPDYPLFVRNISSVNSFQKTLKTYLFQKAFPGWYFIIFIINYWV